MSNFTPEQESALRDLDAAAKNLRASKSPNAEKQYAAAYRAAVAVGAKPKLKSKYNHR